MKGTATRTSREIPLHGQNLTLHLQFILLRFTLRSFSQQSWSIEQLKNSEEKQESESLRLQQAGDAWMLEISGQSNVLNAT